MEIETKFSIGEIVYLRYKKKTIKDITIKCFSTGIPLMPIRIDCTYNLEGNGDKKYTSTHLSSAKEFKKSYYSKIESIQKKNRLSFYILERIKKTPLSRV